MTNDEKWTPAARSIAEEFGAWMRDEELSQMRIAPQLGCSTSVVSELIAGKYTGDVARFIAKMDRILERTRLRKFVPKPPEFVETTISERVREAVLVAHLERVITLVLGPTGIGKSMALREYRRLEPETVYVEAGPGCAPSALTRLLAGALNIEWRGSAYQMRLEITGVLAGTDRLLIVDEADYLPERTLHCLRIISGGAEIGLVLSGTYAYLEKLRRRRSSTIQQVLGRIAYVEHLSRCTAEDLGAIAGQVQLLSDDAQKALVAGARGEARRAVAALTAAKRMSQGGISASHIRDAYESLMPVEV